MFSVSSDKGKNYKYVMQKLGKTLKKLLLAPFLLLILCALLIILEMSGLPILVMKNQPNITNPTALAEVTTVLGSFPASSDTVDLRGGR